MIPPDVPSFLSKSSATLHLEDEKLEDFKKSSQEKVNVDKEHSVNDGAKPPPLAGANVMNIILVACECSPWSNTGGLGDVAGALPKALARRGHRFMEGDQVDIVSLIDSSKVVAIGRLQGMDPSNLVGGYQLGLGWYEILIQVVKAYEEQLIRPYSPMEIIGDALGAPITWPSKLVKFHEGED